MRELKTLDEQRWAIRDAWEDDLIHEGISPYSRVVEIVERMMQTASGYRVVLCPDGVTSWGTEPLIEEKDAVLETRKTPRTIPPD